MNNESKMNCTDFCHIIESGTISEEQMTLLKQHMDECGPCRKYYMLVHHSIEHADEFLPDQTPDSRLAAEIGKFVFNAVQYARVVPLWVKISTAAAAIVFGLLIGSAVYDSRTQSAPNLEYSMINDNSDTVYMAETTEIMYGSFLSENEGE
ncbi:hypothetical protein SDC9_59378 [bioreactor metagenome]|uniref:Zinc-finger domain-containing protein n=1 Tax=bioreactor metagenome TaxID=1076179 RepID=A0A644XFT6_9ZZZZ